MNISTKGKGEKSHEKYEKNCSTGYVCCHGSRYDGGCGSSSDSSSSDSKGSSKSGDKVELTLGIWDENQRDAMQKMIDAYEAENDNVSISIQLTPYKGGEYWTKLEASAGGGTAPDVFWLNVLHLDSYVKVVSWMICLMQSHLPTSKITSLRLW